MTQLLQQAIERLQSLPTPQQDYLAGRILSRIEEEQRIEAALLADLDAGIQAADAGDVVDGDAFLAELKTRYAE